MAMAQQGKSSPLEKLSVLRSTLELLLPIPTCPILQWSQSFESLTWGTLPALWGASERNRELSGEVLCWEDNS